MKPLIIPCRPNDFDLEATFETGQCFRWEKTGKNRWEGVAFGRRLSAEQREDAVVLGGAPEDALISYFDLNRNYAALKKQFSQDPALRKAVEFAPGLRLLKQDPWETLCSFILSQNNNIPRIKGIVAKLCEAFGDSMPGGVWAFPSAQRLAQLDESALAPLRAGYRAAYLIDAAQKTASGEICLDRIAAMPLDEARAVLKKIKGVGPKVAECALLYGFGRAECFPVDVWIRRVLSCLYPGGFPQKFAPVAGIAQQYLFSYARLCPEAKLA